MSVTAINHYIFSGNVGGFRYGLNQNIVKGKIETETVKSQDSNLICAIR